MEPTLKKQTILVVDDTPDNIEVLRGILRANYKVKVALNGENALEIAAAKPIPDMILLDVMMPNMDGHEVCRRLKNNPVTARIPIIFITAKNEPDDEQLGLELGAVDYLTKPISPPIVSARVRTHLALDNQRRDLEILVQQRTEELFATRLEIIHRLSRTAEFKDNETGLHVIRMSYYSKLIAKALRSSDEWTDLIFNAAPMHDIGKIGIPDRVLLKQGPLDDDEWLIMKKHPIMGAEIIGEHHSELLQLAQQIALTHHERWDGTGYPHGIKGENIPLAGRICALADVFDALTSARPYKKAWSIEQAVATIDQSGGTHFDPALIPIFHKILPEAIKIKERYSEHGA